MSKWWRRLAGARLFLVILGLTGTAPVVGRSPDPGQADATAPETVYDAGRMHQVTRLGEDRIRMRGHVFAVAPRILVKSALRRDDLERRFPQALAIHELARLAEASLYLLALDESSDAIRFAERVHAEPGIVYAQPDLSSLNRSPAAYPAQTHGLMPERTQPGPVPVTGKGVRIALIDDGFDLSHEELRHVRPALAYDVDHGLLDASPKSGSDTHGTRVAGLIFARRDGRGVEGIAPDAELIALRQADTWTSHMALAFALAKLAGADIVNCAWSIGYVPEPVADTLDDLVRHGRGGLGTLVVLAAGNDGAALAARNPMAALPGVITVGARHGRALTAYSNRGTLMDLTAPTDLPSLTRGNGYHRFGGTSASAALVSGTAALALAEDPDLPQAALAARLASQFPVNVEK